MRVKSRQSIAVWAWLTAALLAGFYQGPSQAMAQQFRASSNPSQRMIANQPRQRRVVPIETKNFLVYANDEILARKVSAEAERFRRELAIQWLGKEIPAWRDKCPITVEVNRNAGGETSFAFEPSRSGKGMPVDWQMKIFGPPNRILDAVLPHEVTHTIFATHFGRPLPRWADEGACTTVEHESERRKNHKMLLEFLRSKPSRGIPFNRMFTMRNYPHDILPLYAQGYSLARFLIMKKGRRHFVDFISSGLRNESRFHELRAWDLATQEFYGHKDLSDLQIQWLGWVKGGSKESEKRSGLGALASSKNGLNSGVSLSSYNQGINFPQAKGSETDQQVGVASFIEVAPIEMNSPKNKSLASIVSPHQQTFTNSTKGSWYGQEMKKGEQIASDSNPRSSNKARKVPSLNGSNSPEPIALDSRHGLPLGLPKTIWR